MMSNTAPSSGSDNMEKLALTHPCDYSKMDTDMLDGYLEEFRQALLKGDEGSKKSLQKRLYNVVLGWVRLHPKSKEACCIEKEEYYVFQAFEHFWQMATNKELEFSSCATMLQLLQVSLNSVIMNTLRSYLRTEVVSMPEVSVSTIQVNSDEVWENLQKLLPSARDQRVAYLVFHCGFTPEKIIRFYPQDFSDPQEISRLRHYIIKQALLK